MDLLSSLGMKGYSKSKDRGAQLFDEGLIELQEKYPTLCKLSATATKAPRKKSNSVPFLSLALSNGDIPTPSASSSSETAMPSNSKAKSIDYSGTKLALLDQPGYGSGIGPRMGKRKLKSIRKKLKDRTKGPDWFEMTAPEITSDRKNDLEALRLRGALDTKRFYKRNAGSVAPKYFQVGKIVGNAADFYNSRVTKKQRKRTIAEEMLAENKNYYT